MLPQLLKFSEDNGLIANFNDQPLDGDNISGVEKWQYLD